MRIHAASNVLRARVIVVEDGEVVTDGRLSDLVRTDGEEAENVDIYVNPDDAKGSARGGSSAERTVKGG